MPLRRIAVFFAAASELAAVLRGRPVDVTAVCRALVSVAPQPSRLTTEERMQIQSRVTPSGVHAEPQRVQQSQDPSQIGSSSTPSRTSLIGIMEWPLEIPYQRLATRGRRDALPDIALAPCPSRATSVLESSEAPKSGQSSRKLLRALSDPTNSPCGISTSDQ